MTSVAIIDNDHDFSDGTVAAEDKLDASALDAQLSNVKNKLNALLTALGLVIRDDDTLVDEIVRLRNLHPEITTLIAANDAWLPKTSVACASTGNLALTGEQTIDGVLTSASRVLVKDQTAPAENGIYVTGAGAWTRATDADTAAELGLACVLITGGTVGQNNAWVQSVIATAITLGTTALTWVQFAGTNGITAVSRGGTGQSAIAAWPTVLRKGARVAATVSTNIAAPGATVDGVTMAAGDRVLLTAQGTPSQNGLWTWNGAAIAMSRPLDFAGASTVQAYQDVVVNAREGTLNAGTTWRISTAGAITIDTTAHTWLAIELTSRATGGTVARTLAAQAADVSHVKNFAARGDGATDDTAGVQAAIDAGTGAVYIPVGTFICSALTIPDGCRLFGPGTIKRKTTAGISAAEHYFIDATGSSDWSIEDITIDGNKAGQTGSAGFKVSGLLIRGGSDIRLDNVTFKNCHENCVEMTTVAQTNPIDEDTPPAAESDLISRVKIVECTFIDSGRNVDDGFGYSDSMAVQIGSATDDVLVQGCTVHNCMAGILAAAYNKRLRILGNTLYVDSATLTYRSTGIAVEQMSDGCTVADNTVEGFREGLNIESVFRTAITGNTIRNCIRGINCFASAIDGVLINMRAVTIGGNTVTGSTQQSISVRKSSGNAAIGFTVTGNHTDGGTYGIELNGIEGFTCTGNECSGAGTGIAVVTGSKGKVTGNECRSNTTEGLFFEACDQVVASTNLSVSNTYGIYAKAGQTDLTLHNNELFGNATDDLFIQSVAANHVRHWDNCFVTDSGAMRTLSASGDSLKWGGKTQYIAAATYQGLIEHHNQKAIRLIALGAVTLKHNTGASGSKFFNRAGADLVLAANQAVTYVSDGSHLYEA